MPHQHFRFQPSDGLQDWSGPLKQRLLTLGVLDSSVFLCQSPTPAQAQSTHRKGKKMPAHLAHRPRPPSPSLQASGIILRRRTRPPGILWPFDLWLASRHAQEVRPRGTLLCTCLGEPRPQRTWSTGAPGHAGCLDRGRTKEQPTARSYA